MILLDISIWSCVVGTLHVDGDIEAISTSSRTTKSIVLHISYLIHIANDINNSISALPNTIPIYNI